MTEDKEKEVDSLYLNNISEIVVLPPLESLDDRKDDLNECFFELINFVDEKTSECQQVNFFNNYIFK